MILADSWCINFTDAYWPTVAQFWKIRPSFQMRHFISKPLHFSSCVPRRSRIYTSISGLNHFLLHFSKIWKLLGKWRSWIPFLRLRKFILRWISFPRSPPVLGIPCIFSLNVSFVAPWISCSTVPTSFCSLIPYSVSFYPSRSYYHSLTVTGFLPLAPPHALTILQDG